MHDFESYKGFVFDKKAGKAACSAERRLDDVAQFDTLQDSAYHDIVQRMTINSDAGSREDVQEMIASMDSDSAFMCALVDLLTVYRHTSACNKLIAIDNLHHAYTLAIDAHADNNKFSEAQHVMRCRKNAAFENLGSKGHQNISKNTIRT